MTSTCAHYIGDSTSKVERFLPQAWGFVDPLVSRRGRSHNAEIRSRAIRDLYDCGEIENR
jgi:hypothetical protein